MPSSGCSDFAFKKGSRPALVAAVAFAAVFLINVCFLVYTCGCRSLWNGAASECNIHRPEEPDCPWCAHPLAGGGVAFGATVLVQAGIVRLAGRRRLFEQFGVAVLAFPPASAVVGLVQGWWWGYGPG